MRKKIAVRLLILACVLCVAGCRQSAGDPPAAGEVDVDGTMSELDSFTAELLNRVESANDSLSGVGSAQQFLDEKKAGIRDKIVALKRSRKFLESEAARGKLLEHEVDNTSRVAKLKTRYMDRAMSDAAFNASLDRLVNDYQDLFRE